MKGADFKGIKGICLDIDETLSTKGKLTAEAYQALWNLKGAGLAVVPITGRPAGWCDQIARFWPVDAVVGENGAFTFFMRDGVRQRVDTPRGISSADAQKKFDAMAESIKKKFPQAKWASDQKYREFDLAIDICEDVPAWSDKDVADLLKLCHLQGAHAKLSSVHVNAWFGEFDKAKGFKHFLDQGLSPMKWDEWLFIGDSPNDEPLFAAFKRSVGVANLKKYLPQIKNPPTWLTEAESGAGFAEMARELIAQLKKR